MSLFFTLPSILRAAATQNVDIKVSINASRSLALNTSDYYYGALAVGISSVSAAPIVVTNDSGGLLESYAMSAGDAISDTGIIDWTLNQTVVSTDTYRLGAQFSATPPPNSDLNWDSSDYLSKTLQPCTSTQFGNGNASQSGANVSSKTGFKTRTLWFRIHTPDQVTDGGGHTAHVTISVQ